VKRQLHRAAVRYNVWSNSTYAYGMAKISRIGHAETGFTRLYRYQFVWLESRFNCCEDAETGFMLLLWWCPLKNNSCRLNNLSIITIWAWFRPLLILVRQYRYLWSIFPLRLPILTFSSSWTKLELRWRLKGLVFAEEYLYSVVACPNTCKLAHLIFDKKKVGWLIEWIIPACESKSGYVVPESARW
jgi:hypothetical protein